MTAKEHAQAAKTAAQGTWYGYKIRPHSPRWNAIMHHLDAIIAGEPAPPPPPPPPQPRLAPRTYNLASNNSDPRFCVQSSGVTRRGDGLYIDEGGYLYNGDGMNVDGGNLRDRGRMVPGLKPSNEMDGRGPCDPYGQFPPWPAESYER